MCDYKVLSHNENGYVILCNSCRHYQLAFGTTMVTFEPDYFKDFCAQVLKTRNDICDTGFERQKSISLNVFSNNSMMVLDHKELLLLTDILNETLFDEELDALIRELNLIRK